MKQFLSNISALYLIQAVNILIPLTTFPFLVRMIGFENFGVLSYALSWMQIGVIFVTLGFNYTGTQEVAANQDNPRLLGEIGFSVLVTKLTIAGVAACLIFMAARFDPILSGYPGVVLCSIPLLLGEALFPAWFLMGCERMAWIALCNLCGRFITAGLLFGTVRSPQDLWIAALCQSTSLLFAALIALTIMAKYLQIKINVPSPHAVWVRIQTSIRAFSSSLPANIYVRGQFLVLGNLTTAEVVAYYSIAQRITGLFTTVAAPIAETMFPKLCQQIDAGQSIKILRNRVLFGALIVGPVFTAVLWLTLPYIIRFISGEVGKSAQNAVDLARWYVPIVCFIGISVLMKPFAMALQRYQYILGATSLAAVMFLVISYPLVTCFQGRGMVITMLAVEGVITLFMILLSKPRS